MSQSFVNSEQTPHGQAPGVSVVLPILNEERYLDDAITAILAQRYDGPLEVILALGPSKDKTNEIAASLAARDPRVVLVDNPTGRPGLIPAFKTAAAETAAATWSRRCPATAAPGCPACASWKDASALLPYPILLTPVCRLRA